MSNKNQIAAIVITKNEEQMIANCIESLTWCDELVVVDNGSTDHTVELAKRAGATIVKMPNASIPALRNAGREATQSEWLLYIDADERVTPKLKKTIQLAITNVNYAAYALKRNNIHYGKWMQHGGWQNDAIVRLFKTEKLEKWDGDIHEHAVIQGETGLIHEPLVHLTHRSFLESLKKSIEWTPIEARLLHEAGHPKMTTLRLIKVVFDEFIKRFLFQKSWKDGTEGNIETMTQAMNRFFVYVQLWEMQRKPSLPETYEKIEKEIANQWKNDRA